MQSTPDDINTEITPREFELLVCDYLTETGKELKTFTARHDVEINKTDGDYQIDVYAEFEYLGANFKILVECKRHKNKIKREVVQLLFDKLRATGSQKGIIFSTSKFQEGAVIFAKEHGIALIHVINGKYTFFTKSNDAQAFNPPPWVDIPKYVGEFRTGGAICFLQKGYMESLDEFIFNK